jgi:multidrug efflux pump subunit AcrB
LGLAIGTVFTLGVVPVLYTLFFRIASPKQTAA